LPAWASCTKGFRCVFMKKNAPPEFLNEYYARRRYLDQVLQELTRLLTQRLAQLSARTGTRARLVDYRVKRPGKVWKNGLRAGLSVAEMFVKVEDLIGLRFVCNNLSDIDSLVEMIDKDCALLNVVDVKNMVSAPSRGGYRAVHVRAETVGHLCPGGIVAPCEIQIRTLAQDTWARLSRSDLYGTEPPAMLQKLAMALATQLSSIDDIAQLIRDELNRCPNVADDIADSDAVSPSRLALLFKGKYGEDLFEWNSVEWIQLLQEAEADSIGEVRRLLDDDKTRSKIDEAIRSIRGFGLENHEWAVHSARIASEISRKAGVAEVIRRVRAEWEEIAATARREILSEMPETVEEFIGELRAGDVSMELLRELGGVGSCSRCATAIILTERAAISVLEYYGEPEVDVDLESLFQGLPEAESVDASNVCSYCGHQMLRDD